MRASERPGSAEWRPSADHVPVIVVDFAGTRRLDRLDAAITTAAPHLPVSRFDPVRALAGRPDLVPLEQIAAQAATGWTAHPPAPIVAGYCGAACLALKIGAALGGGVVLVRPTLPTPDLVAAEFTRCVAALGGTATPLPGPTGPPAFEWLRAEVESAADAFATRELGSDLRVGRQIRDHYIGWLGFLLSSVDAAATPWSYHGRLRVVGDWAPGAPAWGLPDAVRFGLPEPEPVDAVTPAVLDAVLRAIDDLATG